MPKIYRFECKKRTHERTEKKTCDGSLPIRFQITIESDERMRAKIFTASNKWFRTTPEFLCASVVVIQCEKRIKPNKTTFAATINSGCFGCFRFLPAATSWILDFGVCGLPETPERKSNYCFNKKLDRFFSPSLSNRICLSHSTCSVRCTCSLQRFLWQP